MRQLKMMPEQGPSDMGQGAYQMGVKAIDRAVEEAQTLCAWQKRASEKLTAPEAVRLQTRLDTLSKKRCGLEETIRQGPIGDVASLRLKRNCYWALAAVLVVTGILFAHLALAPFGLGWETWGFSVAIGLVAAFWTHQTLAECGRQRLIQTICVGALVASLLGILILAVVRGDILAMHLGMLLATDSGSGTADAAGFYRSAVWKLQVLFGLLAVAMELASGLAAHRAENLSVASHTAAEKARQVLPAIEDEIADTQRALKALEVAPDLHEAQFMSEYCRGFIDRTQRLGLRYVSILSVIFFLWIGMPRADAQPLDVVVALDLTRSMAAPSYDGKTDSAKNVEALEGLVLQLPAAARLTVIGITDQSFSRPYVLLSRELPGVHGPLEFLDQVETARRRIAVEVRHLGSIEPRYQRTDVFGALRVASDLFAREPQRRRVLVLYSDLRHVTEEINLETPPVIAFAETLARVKRLGLGADLRGVELYAYGVHASGKNARYWESLKRFWTAYFNETGATLKTFALTSGAPTLLGSSAQAAGRQQ